MYTFYMETLPGLMSGGYNLDILEQVFEQKDYQALLNTNNVEVRFVAPRIVDGCRFEMGFTTIRLIVGEDKKTHAVMKYNGETYNFKYREDEQVVICPSHTQLIGKLVELHNMDVGYGGKYIQPNDFLQKLHNATTFGI